MLNRVKGATPFERRDGIKRDNPPLLSVERRQTRRSISIERNSTAVDAKFEFASLRKRSTSKARSATEKKAFCARQKISFHHTPKTQSRQPRARRNNATFLAKILAFSTKPFVSVVFLSKFALVRLNRRAFDAPNVAQTQNGDGSVGAFSQFAAKIIARWDAVSFNTLTI